MEQLIESDAATAHSGQHTAFWRSPSAWMRERNLGRPYWAFFTAAFFFDFGFAVYAFLFNLYLLDLHFNERAIGLIGGALMLGSVAGTLPAGLLARRFGLRPLLIVAFIAAPTMGILRAVIIAEPAQIGLAFVAGLSMCLWGVCFLPAVAGTTTEGNRASGFSLICSASVGTAMLGGVVCGYLPRWLSAAGFAMQPAEVKRLILVAACAIAALGLFAVLRMRLPSTQAETTGATTTPGNAMQPHSWRRLLQVDPFLLRFLPAMALWTAVLTSFTPFANVYLSRVLHVPMLRIGLVFSTVQIVQLCITLLTPMLFRALGLVNGIVAAQLATAMLLGSLAVNRDPRLAIGLYLGFAAMQWTSAPGLYNLLMSKMPVEERSTASSMMMFCNALVGATSTAGAGFLFTRFGYPRVLAGIAVLAVVATIVLRWLVGPASREVSVQS